jgi:hypothetical protein
MGLKGYRLWAMGQLDSTCRAPPRAPSGTRAASPHCSGTSIPIVRANLKKPGHRIVGARVLKPGACTLHGAFQACTSPTTSARVLLLHSSMRMYTLAASSKQGGHSHSRGVSDWLHVRPELDLWVALTPLPGVVRLVYMAYWLS